MRLFIATPSHYLQGGVERTLQGLARHLPARGIEVVVGLAKGARFHDPDLFRRAFPEMQTIDVEGTSGTAYGRQRGLRRAILQVDPDVVLNARLFDTYPVASALKLEGHRLRLAVTLQAYETDFFVDLARYAAFVDSVLTSGELLARAVRQFTPIEAVGNAPGGVAPPQRSRAPRPGPLRLGYVGRLEQVQKRIRDLPLLCEELERRGIPFTICVAGGGTVEDELRARMPRAELAGWLSVGELYERVYPELDVLVHFADYEGLPIAPREAMAHGVVPVISRFIGGEDFDEGVNALKFPIGDIGAAADCIERLHRDRALLERLSAAASLSQTGLNSEQGAIDAWAAMLRAPLERPARVGASLPPAPADSGLLTRLGVPPPLAEVVRRLRRRQHSGPGSEWPHWSGIHDPELERAVSEFARRA
jgi:glycosyltransferase involved in cell wall biosynthesis